MRERRGRGGREDEREARGRQKGGRNLAKITEREREKEPVCAL